LLSTVVLALVITSCGQATQKEMYELHIEQSLDKISLSLDDISLPRLPYPIALPGRLPTVDSVLEYPPRAIGLGTKLKDTNLQNSRSEYIADLLGVLDMEVSGATENKRQLHTTDALWTSLIRVSGEADFHLEVPDEWRSTTPLFDALRTILTELVALRQAWNEYGGAPSDEEMASIRAHLDGLVTYSGSMPEPYMLTPAAYHKIGSRINLKKLVSSHLKLLATIESVLPEIAGSDEVNGILDWSTPLGLVRVAGKQNDIHEGSFLLLIDLGGDDAYLNVGTSLSPGSLSVVVDMDGNDKVRWDSASGPGSGVLGMGLWLDLAGNDRYQGGNMGLGSALLGSGIFWDDAGNDVYESAVFTQGAGQYGIGVFVDAEGNDRYDARMSGQGHGGTGGIGLLADLGGNDSYACGGKIPDRDAARVNRHKGIHYMSQCQGYGMGLRPDISGGIGLLIDLAGDDTYKADIFGQGGAYWFGLGMLLDVSGDDRYECHEHCQGAALHLAAGFLGDWSGNDAYIGYEHAQGVGIDRAAGILYDESGNDSYRAYTESQGAGIKPLGVGTLIDIHGDDKYETRTESQGYAKPEPGFPESEWPVGMLLDLEGNDEFEQPYATNPDSAGRIQNRQGIAVDR
jgi:hypothetical protein